MLAANPSKSEVGALKIVLNNIIVVKILFVTVSTKFTLKTRLLPNYILIGIKET